MESGPGITHTGKERASTFWWRSLAMKGRERKRQTERQTEKDLKHAAGMSRVH
jgi:hypothetical protein